MTASSCAAVTVTGISWPGKYDAGSPSILMLPPPLFRGEPIWHAAQFPSAGAFVKEGEGPDADANATGRLEIIENAASDIRKKPMTATLSRFKVVDLTFIVFNPG